MKKVFRNFFSLVLTTVLLSGICAGAVGPDSPDYSELAAVWAPTIYQDVTTSYDVRADFLTRFDFDGDWAGGNNWENAFSYPLTSAVYYSVQETETHYFINYFFFHPRDDGPISAEKHENDFEGALFVIKKDGTPYGSFVLMETQAHNHFYQYSNDSNIIDGSDDIDGAVIFDNEHPCVYISPNGIGTNAGHGVRAYDGSAAQGDDGIIYRYTDGLSMVPENASGNYEYVYDYELISMDVFWERRYDIGGPDSTFGAFGQLYGDTYGKNKAKMPWAWDDPDDGPAMIGVNWSDPAHFVDVHFDGLGDFSHTYLYNPYFSHMITINSITSLSNEDAFNDESDIYLYLAADNEKHIDARFWKFNQAELNVPKSVFFGKDNAEFGDHFSEAYNTLYICMNRDIEIVFEVRDADALGAYNSMGTVSITPAPGETIILDAQLTSDGKAMISAVVVTN